MNRWVACPTEGSLSPKELFMFLEWAAAKLEVDRSELRVTIARFAEGRDENGRLLFKPGSYCLAYREERAGHAVA